MLDILHAAEKDLPRLLASAEGWRSYKLDDHLPFVDRMLREYRDGKLYLHRIHACAAGVALYHPHPWPSAMRILEGTYEMVLGHGAGDRAPPPVAARLIASGAFEYEMTDPNAWHSVRPIGAPAMTVMVTGPRWDRPPSQSDRLPTLREDKPPSPLSAAELVAMLEYYRRRYA
jgi:hypothetical protein